MREHLALLIEIWRKQLQSLTAENLSIQLKRKNYQAFICCVEFSHGRSQNRNASKNILFMWPMRIEEKREITISERQVQLLDKPVAFMQHFQ